MPLFKHLRSDYVHLDSVEPDLWTRITALFRNVLVDDAVPLRVNIIEPHPVHVIDAHEIASFSPPEQHFNVTSKFGRNLSIANGVTNDVWSVGGDRVWLAAAVHLEAISGSGLDTDGGTGAQIIVVQGLDENWDEVEENITMNGVSASAATTASFIRVNRSFVYQTGTYVENNVGTIVIRTSGGGATQTNIVAGEGQTEQTHYSLARNRNAIVLSMYISTDSGKKINASLYQNSGIDDVTTPYVGAMRKVWGVTGLLGATSHEYSAHPKLIGPADLWWRATSFANGTEVEAGFDLLIQDV